jgi:hypothetical protein
MVQSRSSEGISPSSDKEILRLLWNTKFQHCVYKNRETRPMLNKSLEFDFILSYLHVGRTGVYY